MKECHNLILIEVLESVVSVHVTIFRVIRLSGTPSCWGFFFLD